MKKVLTLGFAVLAMSAFVSCSSKKSAYKAAYEKAMQEDEEEIIVKEEPVVKETPVVKVEEDEEIMQEGTIESVQPVVTPKVSSLKRYSVIGGSFANKEGADATQASMRAKGYDCQLAYDEEKGLYRVVMATFDSKSDAEANRASLKKSNPTLFEDAWILE